MFISRKKLEKIIEEEKYRERENIFQERNRQREREEINNRFNELERRVWELTEKVEKRSRIKKR